MLNGKSGAQEYAEMRIAADRAEDEALAVLRPTASNDSPAIPEGMVAWHGGDSAPEDWDGGQVLIRDGSVYLHNNHPTGRWQHGEQREKYYPHRSDLDIIAYTPRQPSAPAIPDEHRDAHNDQA